MNVQTIKDIIEMVRRIGNTFTKAIAERADKELSEILEVSEKVDAVIAERDLLKKAVVCIEFISLYEDEDNLAMANVYRLAHVARGECLADHNDWKVFLEAMYDGLVKQGKYPSDEAGKLERERRINQAVASLTTKWKGDRQ